MSAEREGRRPFWHKALKRSAGAGLFFGVAMWLLGVMGAAEAITVGVLFGLVEAWFTRSNRRKLAKEYGLDVQDWDAVDQAVGRGEDIGDVRLAPAVLRWAQRLEDRRTNDRWTWVPIALLLSISSAFAIAFTAGGHVRTAVGWWVAVATLVVVFAWFAPRDDARTVSNARLAAEAARRRL